MSASLSKSELKQTNTNTTHQLHSSSTLELEKHLVNNSCHWVLCQGPISCGKTYWLRSIVNANPDRYAYFQCYDHFAQCGKSFFKCKSRSAINNNNKQTEKAKKQNKNTDVKIDRQIIPVVDHLSMPDVRKLKRLLGSTKCVFIVSFSCHAQANQDALNKLCSSATPKTIEYQVCQLRSLTPNDLVLLAQVLNWIPSVDHFIDESARTWFLRYYSNRYSQHIHEFRKQCYQFTKHCLGQCGRVQSDNKSTLAFSSATSASATSASATTSATASIVNKKIIRLTDVASFMESHQSWTFDTLHNTVTHMPFALKLVASMIAQFVLSLQLGCANKEMRSNYQPPESEAVVNYLLNQTFPRNELLSYIYSRNIDVLEMIAKKSGDPWKDQITQLEFIGIIKCIQNERDEIQLLVDPKSFLMHRGEGEDRIWRISPDILKSLK